jgi:arylsulfatase A-like enzyme
MSKTTRRDVLKGAAVAGLAGVLGCQDSKTQPATASAPVVPPGKLRWEQPPAQKGNNLNVIVLVSDTFRADNLEAYGSQWVETPYLNQFAKEATIFESFHPEGMPTVPIRRQLFSGRRIAPTHLYFQQDAVKLPGWHELFLEDVTLAETLLAAGYQTALVADVYHIMKPGRNFHRGFNYWEWIRGQEVDFYAQAPRQIPDLSGIYPADYLDLVRDSTGDRSGGALPKFLNQYLANRKRWKQYGDSIPEQTAKAGIRWLKENHDQGPFYLHVEMFDPHEPWDPPVHFLEKYLKEPTKHSWLEPPYGNVKVPEEGVKRLRANYAGEASNVDYWYGQVLDTVKKLGLYENTIIVFVADHGALLNEQGQWVKGPEKIRKQVTHVPLLVHVPGNPAAGKRVAGFGQTPDVAPTVLGRLGLKPSSRVTGEDLWPYATGEKTNKREYIVSSYGYIAGVRTPEWNYSTIWEQEKYQGKYAPQLYDLKNDPDELKSVADQNPAVVKDLHAKLQEYLDSGRDLTNGTFSQEL